MTKLAEAMERLRRRADVSNEDKYGPAMEILDPDEASTYLSLLVDHQMGLQPHMTRGDAIAFERSNLGYYAGYYSAETQGRVELLFQAVHPILGPRTTAAGLTAEEIYQRGLELGRLSTEGKPLPKFEQSRSIPDTLEERVREKVKKTRQDK